MNHRNFVVGALKIVGTIFCVGMFFLLMVDIWNKFTNKMTHTRSRNVYTDQPGKKQLPCLTVCPMAGFKQPGFFFDENSFTENCFKLEEIFCPETISHVQNKSIFLIKKTMTLEGCCYTLCSLKKWRKMFGPYLNLKPGIDVKIYIHVYGNEFWLNGWMDFPFDIPIVIIDVTNTKGYIGGYIYLTEIDSTFLSTEEMPCKAYSTQLDQVSFSLIPLFGKSVF
jgi:hypothetical protein